MRREIFKISQYILIIFLLAGSAEIASAIFDSEDKAFLDLINNYRTENNLGTLSVDAKLEDAAIWMSDDLIKNCMTTGDTCSHTDSTGRTFSERLRAFGYPSGTTASTAENIVSYVNTAQDAFDIWKNSPGHNKNMLGSGYIAIGISRSCNSNGNCAWVIDLGSQVVESFDTNTRTAVLKRSRCWNQDYVYNSRCWDFYPFPR